jgi:hypothetical protein
MPVCPGCERIVSHDRLPVHLRCCETLRSDDDGAPVSISFEQHIMELEERLTRELREHEEDVERRLLRLESELQAQ